MDESVNWLYMFWLSLPLLANWGVSLVLETRRGLTDEQQVAAGHSARLYGTLLMLLFAVLYIWQGLIPLHWLATLWEGNRLVWLLSAGFALLAWYAALRLIRRQPEALPPALTGGWNTDRGRLRFGLVWIAYLALYEWWFRGCLLLSPKGWSPTLLIAYNLLLYALVHAHKSRKEVLGTLPFGLLACLASFAAQSALPALFGHLGLSLTVQLRRQAFTTQPAKRAMSYAV